MGRKAGRNTVADRVTLSQHAKELAAQETLMVRNPKEFSRAKKVEELNKRFFDTRLKPVEKPAPQTEAIAEQMFESENLAPVETEDLISQYELAPPTAPKFSVEA